MSRRYAWVYLALFAAAPASEVGAQGIGARGAVEVEVEAADEPPPPSEEQSPRRRTPGSDEAVAEAPTPEPLAEPAAPSPTPAEGGDASAGSSDPAGGGEVNPGASGGEANREASGGEAEDGAANAGDPRRGAANADEAPTASPGRGLGADATDRAASRRSAAGGTGDREPGAGEEGADLDQAAPPSVERRPIDRSSGGDRRPELDAPAVAGRPIVIGVPTPAGDPLVEEALGLVEAFGGDRSFGGLLGLLVVLLLALVGSSALRSAREGLPRHGVLPRALALMHLGARLLALAASLAFVVRMLPPRMSLVALLAFAGSALALGWSMRDVLPDLVAGVVLAFERRVRRGTWVSTADFGGVVQSVGLRTTELLDGQGRIVSVPNRHFLLSPIAAGRNHEREHEVAVRLHAPGVAADQIRAALRDAVLASPWVFPGTPVVVLRDPEDAALWRVRARLLEATFGARFEGELLERAEAHLKPQRPSPSALTTEVSP